MQGFVHAVFTDVDVLLAVTFGSALTEGEKVKDAAVANDGVERKDLVQRRAEHLH